MVVLEVAQPIKVSESGCENREVAMGMCATHPVPLPGGAELSGHVRVP